MGSGTKAANAGRDDCHTDRVGLGIHTKSLLLLPFS